MDSDSYALTKSVPDLNTDIEISASSHGGAVIPRSADRDRRILRVIHESACAQN